MQETMAIVAEALAVLVIVLFAGTWVKSYLIIAFYPRSRTPSGRFTSPCGVGSVFETAW